MRIGGIGAPELLIVLLIVLLIFGAGKLPEVFGSLGKGLREFKKSQNEDPEQIAESATDTTAPRLPFTLRRRAKPTPTDRCFYRLDP